MTLLSSFPADHQVALRLAHHADPDVVILPPRPTGETMPDTAAVLEDALFQIKRVIVGQDRMVERALVCLLARGHCLIEGVPGLAKTLTVSTMANVVGGSFTRIQFTP